MKGGITLYSEGGKITFGREGYILHEIENAPPKVLPAGLGTREITLRGYILPTGEDDTARLASLDALSRRVMRLVMAEGGFYMEEWGRTLHLICTEAPHFSREAPFAEGDAALFTVRAISEENIPYYTEAPRQASARGMEGKLVFPLAITEQTVFATLSQSGVITVVNPGDVPCGFTAAITADRDTVDSITLTLGEEQITVPYPLAAGEVMTICTVPGQKDVLCGDTSLLSYVDWRSTFFALAPGENRLAWQAEGGGCPRLTLTLTPLYL